MTAEQIRQKAEATVLHTYQRFAPVFTHGKGVYLYDTEGKAYLDFAAGIAVNALGHGHPVFTAALQEQAGKLLHTSNLYYHDILAEAAEKVVHATGLSKVFFTNSGTEAIEGAIKVARKYAWLKDGTSDHEIIAMQHSFHGRSLGALSVTGNAHYREPFQPLIGGIRFAEFNDFDSVESQINEKTCAILLETVQGEGGIYPATPDFLKKLEALCDEKDILLVLDEIQCGMGRCSAPIPNVSTTKLFEEGSEGKQREAYFAYQMYGIRPDIVTSAKALGGGIPVGAFVVNEKVASQSLVPGDHGTTYGGNPLACRAISTVFDIFEQENVLAHVRATTPYLEEKLDALATASPYLKARRGMGFLQGLVVCNAEEQKGNGIPEDKILTPGEIVQKALKKGLLIITAGTDVLRLAPPLIISEEEIDQAVDCLENFLGK